MTVVGEAWVKVKALTSGLDEDIKTSVAKSLKDASPAVEESAKKELGAALAKGAADGYSENLKTKIPEETQKGLRGAQAATNEHFRAFGNTAGGAAGPVIARRIVISTKDTLRSDTTLDWEGVGTAIGVKLRDKALPSMASVLSNSFGPSLTKALKASIKGTEQEFKALGVEMGGPVGDGFCHGFTNAVKQCLENQELFSNTSRRSMEDAAQRAGRSVGRAFGNEVAASNDGEDAAIPRSIRESEGAAVKETEKLGDAVWDAVNRVSNKRSRRRGDAGFGKMTTNLVVGGILAGVTAAATVLARSKGVDLEQAGVSAAAVFGFGWNRGILNNLNQNGPNGLRGGLLRSVATTVRGIAPALNQRFNTAGRGAGDSLSTGFSGTLIRGVGKAVRLVGTVFRGMGRAAGAVFRGLGALGRGLIGVLKGVAGAAAGVVKSFGGKALGMLKKNWIGMLVSIIMLVVKVILLMWAAVTVIQIVAALLGAIIILVASLGKALLGAGMAGLGLFASLGIAALAFKLAFSKNTDALKKFKAQLDTTKKAFDPVVTAVQQTLLPALGRATANLTKLVPVAREGMGKVGEALGRAAEYISKVLTSSGNLARLKDIFSGTARVIDGLGVALGEIVNIFLILLRAAMPLATATSQWAANSLAGFRAMLEGKERTGELAKTMEGFGRSLRNWLGIFKSLWGAVSEIFKVASSYTDQVEGGIKGALDRFREWLKTPEGKSKVIQFFENAIKITGELMDAIREIVAGLGEVATADASGTVKTIGSLKDVIVAVRDNLPGILQAAKTVSDLIGGIDRLYTSSEEAATAKGVQDQIKKLTEDQRIKVAVDLGYSERLGADTQGLELLLNDERNVGPLKAAIAKVTGEGMEAGQAVIDKNPLKIKTDTKPIDTKPAVKSFREYAKYSSATVESVAGIGEALTAINPKTGKLSKNFGVLAKQAKLPGESTAQFEARLKSLLPAAARAAQGAGEVFNVTKGELKLTSDQASALSDMLGFDIPEGARLGKDGVIAAAGLMKTAFDTPSMRLEILRQTLANGVPLAAGMAVAGLTPQMVQAALATTPLKDRLVQFNTLLAQDVPASAALAAAGLTASMITADLALFPVKERAATFVSLLSSGVPAAAAAAAAGLSNNVLPAGMYFDPATQKFTILEGGLRNDIPAAAMAGAAGVAQAGTEISAAADGIATDANDLKVEMKTLEDIGPAIKRAWDGVDWNGLWTRFEEFANGHWSKVTDRLLKPFQDFKDRVQSLLGGYTFTAPTTTVIIPVTYVMKPTYVNGAGAPSGNRPDPDNWRPGQGGPQPVNAFMRSSFTSASIGAVSTSLRSSTQGVVQYGSSTGDGFTASRPVSPVQSATVQERRDERAFLRELKNSLNNLSQNNEIRVFVGNTELTDITVQAQQKREMSLARQLTYMRGN